MHSKLIARSGYRIKAPRKLLLHDKPRSDINSVPLGSCSRVDILQSSNSGRHGREFEYQRNDGSMIELKYV